MNVGQPDTFFSPYGTVIKYEDFHKHEHQSIINLLRRNRGVLFILYPARSRTDGHWVALFQTKGDREGEDVIEFFDPYGLRIEQQWEYTNDNQTRSLARMLAACPIPVVYNELRVQEMSDDIATCGYHCALRVICRGMTLYEYIRALETAARMREMTNDEYVYSSFN